MNSIVSMEDVGIKNNVIPRLHIQIIYMDHPYLETGQDQIILESEDDSSSSDDTVKIKIYTDDSGLVNIEIPENSSIYFFFNYGINSIQYEKSQEFTNLWNNAFRISALYIPYDSFGEIIKIR